MDVIERQRVADVPSPAVGRYVGAAVAVGIVALHLLMLWGNRGPVLYEDAIGYLGNARTLAGGTVPMFDGVNYYSAGYSLLVVPAYLVTQAAAFVWAYVVVLNVVLAALILVPAAWLARNCFDVDRRTSWIVAGAVALTPALLLQSGRGWVEVLFPLVFASGVALMYAAMSRPSPAFAASAGAAFGYLIVIHPRGLAPAAVALAAFVVAPFLTRLRWTGPALAAVGIAGGYLVSSGLRTYLVAAQWTSAPRNAGNVGKVAEALTGPQLGDTLLRALGQVWYLLAVTLGVAVVGGWAWLSWWRHSPTDTVGARRLVGAFCVAATLATLLVSAAFLTSGTRPDHYAYGRYLEGVSPVLLVAGFSALAKGRYRRLLVGAGAGVVVVGLALALLRDPDVFQGWTQKLSIPGLVVLQNVIDLGTGIQMGAIDVLAISALAAGVAVAVALTMRARAAVVALAAVMLAMTLGAKVQSWDPYVGFWYDAANGIPAALDLSDGATAYYERGAGVPEVRNNYEFRIAPARLDTIDGACGITGPGYLITAPDGLGRWANPPTVIARDDVPGLVLVRVPGPPDGCS